MLNDIKYLSQQTCIWNPSCLILKLPGVTPLHDRCNILYLSNRMCVFQLPLKDASSNSFFFLWQYLWQFSSSSAVAGARHRKRLKRARALVHYHICLWRLLPAFQPEMRHCWLAASRTKEPTSLCFASRGLLRATEGPGKNNWWCHWEKVTWHIHREEITGQRFSEWSSEIYH